MRLHLFLALPLAAASSAGCDFAIGCTEELRAGLGVKLLAPDGTTICNAKVTATDGAYSEQLQNQGLPPQCFFSGAWEREGTYRIEVERRGFERAVIEDVDVDADACHVEGVSKEVTLQPKPGCDGLTVPGIAAVVRRADGTRECSANLTSARMSGNSTELPQELKRVDDVEGDCGYHGAIDQAGTFQVVIAIPGEAQISETVEVTEDDCHLQTKRVDFELP